MNGAVKAAPAYSDGVVYVGDYSGETERNRVKNGSIKWQAGSQGAGFARRWLLRDGGRRLRPRLCGRTSTGACTASTSRPGGCRGATPPATTSTPRRGRRHRRHPAHRLLRLLRRHFYALDARTGERALEHPGSRGDLGGRQPDRRHRLRRGPAAHLAPSASTSRNGHKVFEYTDGAYNPVISDGTGSILTGYKTLYELRPGTRPGRSTGSSRSRASASKKQAGGEDQLEEVARSGSGLADRDPGPLHLLLGLGDRVRP